MLVLKALACCVCGENVFKRKTSALSVNPASYSVYLCVLGVFLINLTLHHFTEWHRWLVLWKCNHRVTQTHHRTSINAHSGVDHVHRLRHRLCKELRHKCKSCLIHLYAVRSCSTLLGLDDGCPQKRRILTHNGGTSYSVFSFVGLNLWISQCAYTKNVILTCGGDGKTTCFFSHFFFLMFLFYFIYLTII